MLQVPSFQLVYAAQKLRPQQKGPSAIPEDSQQILGTKNSLQE